MRVNGKYIAAALAVGLIMTLIAADTFTRTLLTLDVSPTVYEDVPTDAWYHDAVIAASDRGITEGTDEGVFSPNRPVDRAMLATMISRIRLHDDGHTVIDGDKSFTDVSDDAWYAEAVRWAADSGIVEGHEDGRFDPSGTATREQLAVMLWRFAGRPQSGHTLDGFTDADSVSGYAREAMAWANENGIINGTSIDILDPKGIATRAQVTRMLINYMDR